MQHSTEIGHREISAKKTPKNDVFCVDPVPRFRSYDQSTETFRPRTGHNRLRRHVFNRLKVGTTDEHTRGTDSVTAQYLLQDWPSSEEPRPRFWLSPVPVHDKLYADLSTLRQTASEIFKLISESVR